MKLRIFLFSLILTGCATFKELEPDPEILPAERGYVELKDGKEFFELDKDGKYFMKFPGPQRDHFYLVLTTPTKPFVHTYLTGTFDDGKGPIVAIPDEASSRDSILVYPIEANVATYYWVIDTVRSDVVLGMRYRYVPQWRYTFENKHAEFRDVLADNKVDRATYNSIDGGFDVNRLDLMREIPYVESRTANLSRMNDELLRLENVFPPDIAASRDTAYAQYVALRGEVDDELSFQSNYTAVLDLLKREQDTRGNVPRFLESVRYFTSFVAQRDRFSQGVIMRVSILLLDRLAEVAPYLDNVVRTKSDIRKISPEPDADEVRALYSACGQPIPRVTENVLRFVNRFNTEVDGLEAMQRKLDALTSDFTANLSTATESFYVDMASRAREIRTSAPEPRTATFEPYRTYACAVMLSREIVSATNTAGDFEMMYQGAGAVAGYLNTREWRAAEMRLRELHETPGTSNTPDVSAQRSALVGRLENDIFVDVRSSSVRRIDAFIKTNEMAIDNVPTLYADSAFRPVYQLTFSSAGAMDLIRKRKEIEDYLDNIKFVRFPESSIKSIYNDFVRNMRDRGVEKARAIVEHGKFYKGSDKQVQGLITECDVQAAKWIIRPKDYRKLFALPVTNNTQGVNEYMFRIRLQIPSEAQFPVFDVHLKLPEEVAEKANREQWYESITIDKNPIKNEGRFRITAPTPETNYESLVTPVQMDKEGRNILEVRFKYPGFRVFEVSAMAQVPIIRKN